MRSCSSREQEFGSQHPCWLVLQMPITPAPRDPTYYAGLYRHPYMHDIHWHRYTFIHTNNKSLLIKVLVNWAWWYTAVIPPTLKRSAKSRLAGTIEGVQGQPGWPIRTLSQEMKGKKKWAQGWKANEKSFHWNVLAVSKTCNNVCQPAFMASQEEGIWSERACRELYRCLLVQANSK